MSSIWTKDFWKAAAERAISTAAQSGVSYLVVAGPVLNALSVDWGALGGIAAGGAVLSLLKSLAVNGATGTGPSLTSAEVVPAETTPVLTERAVKLGDPRDLDGDGRDDTTGRFV